MNKFLIFLSIFIGTSLSLVASLKVNKFMIDPDRLTRAVPEESYPDDFDQATSRSFLVTRRPAAHQKPLIVRNSSPKVFLGGNQR